MYRHNDGKNSKYGFKGIYKYNANIVARSSENNPSLIILMPEAMFSTQYGHCFDADVDGFDNIAERVLIEFGNGTNW